MLSEELHGRYKEYKAKTKDLVYWLTQTAGRHSDLKTVIKSLSTTPAPTLPASSAKRKKNKKKKSEPASSEYQIRAIELVSLAGIIAKADPPIDVPKGVLLNLKDIISRRESCSEWYGAQALQPGSDLEKENQSHQGFILILGRVFDTLSETHTKWRLGKAQAEKAAHTPPDGEEALVNHFDILSCEEPDLDNVTSAPTHILDPASGSPNPEYKLEQEQHDPAFQVWCFLHDLYDIRISVLKTWEGYNAGDCTLLAASLATDIAFSLLRFAGEEFANGCPQAPGTWLGLLDFLNISMATYGQGIWLFPTQGRRTVAEPQNSNPNVKVVELFCPVAFLCLEHFLKEAEKADRSAPSQKHKPRRLNPSGAHPPDLLKEALANFGRLGREVDDLRRVGRRDWPGMSDLWAQSLTEVFESGEISTWAVVLSQIMLDMTDNVTSDMKPLPMEFSELRSIAAEHHSYVVDSCDDIEGGHDALQHLHRVVSTVDRIKDYVNSGLKRKDQLKQKHGLKFTRLSDASVVAGDGAFALDSGLALASIRIELFDAACKVANNTHSVLSCAHIYKALQATGRLGTDLIWSDMEAAILLFGIKAPLLPTRAVRYDAETAVRYYAMDRGNKVIVPGTSGREQQFRKGEPCKLSLHTPILKAMQSRRSHLGHGKDLRCSTSLLETILPTLMISGQNATSNTIPTITHDAYACRQLLDVFKERFRRELPKLNFDLLSFTNSCSGLLSKMTSRVAHLLNTDLKDLPHDGYQSVVDGILRSTAASPVIRETTALVKDYIAPYGGVYCARADILSTGHLRPGPLHTHDPEMRRRHEYSKMMDSMLNKTKARYCITLNVPTGYHPAITQDMLNEPYDPNNPLPRAVNEEFGDDPQGLFDFIGVLLKDHKNGNVAGEFLCRMLSR